MLLPDLVIVGYGNRGSSVASAALGMGFAPAQVAVIDADGRRVDAARRNGHQVVNADAIELACLRVAKVGSAARVAVCVDDNAAIIVVRAVRRIAPDATIQVMLKENRLENLIKAAGADDVLALDTLAGQLLAHSVL